ncbi:MAG: tyrosine-type recombinase/integrase [Cellulosilyticaceae bacterium]
MGRRTQPIYDEKQLLRLLDELEETDPLIYVVAMTMLYTGFRIGDILELTVREVRGDVLVIEENKTKYLKELRKRDIKAGKRKPRQPKPPREVDMHADLKRIYREWTYGEKNSAWVFPSSWDKGKHISYSQVNRRLKQAGHAVGIDGLSTHTLRKTSIYKVYKKTNDLAEAQMYAGHESPKETSDYLGEERIIRNRSIAKMDNLTEKRKKKYI